MERIFMNPLMLVWSNSAFFIYCMIDLLWASMTSWLMVWLFYIFDLEFRSPFPFFAVIIVEIKCSLMTCINEWYGILLFSLITSNYYFRIYHEAISCYERALTISTRSLSTYAGLAYTYHLQVNWVLFILI